MEQDSTTQAIGRNAEQNACIFLQQRGLILIEKNYQCKHGEIDLVMNDKNTIVFVEVRYRKNTDHGSGAETVTYRKQKKLIASATHYLLKRHNTVELPCRIDVVSMQSASTQNVQWIQNAIEKSY